MSLSKKGFTLIELLTVIAIIGILASIVVVAVNEPRKRGRDAKRISDLKSMKTALEMYYEQNQKFPITYTAPATGDIVSNQGAAPLCVNSSYLESTCDVEWINATTGLTKFLSIYLNPLPKAPLNGTSMKFKYLSGTSCLLTNGTTPMKYEYKGNDQSFKVQSRLETLCDGTTDGGSRSDSGQFYEVWGGDGGQAL